MATVTEFTLKKDGSGDYTTINAFLSAQVNGVDFVSLDIVRRLKIFKSGWDASTPLAENFLEVGSGTTTSTTQRPEIVCDGSETHDFTPDTGFVFTINTGFGFVIRGKHLLVDGIELADCGNTTSLWFQSASAELKNTLSHGIPQDGLFGGAASNCIAYDYFPASSNQNNEAFNSGTVTNCTVIAKLAEFGFDGDIMIQNGTADDTLIYKVPAKISFTAYFSATGDFNGVNRTGEGVPGASSQTNLVTSDFNDYANDDYRIKTTSAFATNGTGGGFMGAALAPAGGGITLTGTAVPTQTEADIVTGGKTIILTLAGDTFVAAGTGPIGSTADTQAIIDGLTSAQVEATGWNNEVRDKEVTTAVVRTSSTVATITLTASAAYDITATETITATIPAAVLVTSATPVVATPTFTVTAVSGTILTPYYYTNLLAS